MTEYSFRLMFDAPEELSDDQLNALYEATDSEASFGSDDEGWSAEFDRDAPDFAHAVTSAIRDLMRAGFTVRRLVSDDDTLMNLSEIGRRTHQSREAIRLYAEGERKRELGPFPVPVATFPTGERIWRWGDVTPWLSRATAKSLVSGQNADVVNAINDVLDLNRRRPRLQTKAREAVEELLDPRLVLTR